LALLNHLTIPVIIYVLLRGLAGFLLVAVVVIFAVAQHADGLGEPEKRG